jgi:predicted ABC-type ATPase
MLEHSFCTGRYEAAALALSLRSALVAQRVGFMFETVQSDPHGVEVDQFATYTGLGYRVLVIVIQIDTPEQLIKRVAVRVNQSDHNVPDDKPRARLERTLANLKRAPEYLPHVIFCSNDDLMYPHKLVELYKNEKNISSF